MNDDNYSVINKAIDLELIVSELYLLYQEKFPEDSDFWWDLYLEERNHASILKALLSIPVELSLSDELLNTNTQVLTGEKNRIADFIQKLKGDTVSRDDAYSFALEVEKSAFEVHYQKALKSDSDSSIMDAFKTLNKGDYDHYEKIRELVNKRSP